MSTKDGAQADGRNVQKMAELNRVLRTQERGNAGTVVDDPVANHIHNHTVTLRVGGLTATVTVTGERAPVYEVLSGDYTVSLIGGRTLEFSKPAGGGRLTFRGRVVEIDRWESVYDDERTRTDLNADEHPAVGMSWGTGE